MLSTIKDVARLETSYHRCQSPDLHRSGIKHAHRAFLYELLPYVSSQCILTSKLKVNADLSISLTATLGYSTTISLFLAAYVLIVLAFTCSLSLNQTSLDSGRRCHVAQRSARWYVYHAYSL